MRFNTAFLICALPLAACGSNTEASPAQNKDSADTAAAPSSAPTSQAALVPFRQQPDAEFPALPDHAETASGFVPEGWALVKSAEGDLNKDGEADIVLVMRGTDPEKITPINDTSQKTIDSNPYRLAVAIKQPGSSTYVLAAEDHRLIPRHDDPDITDTFSDLAIKRGAFTIRLSLITNLGGWNVENRTFTFRYNAGKVELIGLDMFEAPRKTAVFISTSINFLTHKIKTEVSHIEDEGEGKITWTTLPQRAAITIETMGNGLEWPVPEAGDEEAVTR